MQDSTNLKIDNIFKNGGMKTLIENGEIQKEIEDSAFKFQENIDSKKIDNHINRLKDLKKKRNNLEVKYSLSILKTVAKTDENVMPQIINCARSRCTLGEISDVLRKVYGEY